MDKTLKALGLTLNLALTAYLTAMQTNYLCVCRHFANTLLQKSPLYFIFR